MNVSTITVHWHDEFQPIYSVDFQRNKDSNGKSTRLVTGGGDNNARIWKLKYNHETNESSVEYISTLKKHTQAVNCVRFSPKGDILATAGDDGMLILWTLSEHIVKDFGNEEDPDLKESWVISKVFRSSNSEIYDISWSPDGQYIATGSMDNITRIYHVFSSQQVFQIAEHGHYVQGVSWDPLDEYLATQSADRSIHISRLKKDPSGKVLSVNPTIFFKISKADFTFHRIVETDSIDLTPKKDATVNVDMSPPSAKHIKVAVADSPVPSTEHQAFSAVLPNVSSPSKSFALKKGSYIYHSETLQSFFRRLKFSPDGSLLLTPSGIYKNELAGGADKVEGGNSDSFSNTVYIYTRAGLNKPPVCHIPGLKKSAIAIAFSPVFYKKSDSIESPVFKLPYKMVFAVATRDSVIVYDTEALLPLGYSSKSHYSTITDLCWDIDGKSIIVSSADGFCSHIIFQGDPFGEALSSDKVAQLRSENLFSLNNEPITEKTNTSKTAKAESFPNVEFIKNNNTTKSLDSQSKHMDTNRIECVTKSISSTNKKKRKIAPTLITK